MGWYMRMSGFAWFGLVACLAVYMAIYIVGVDIGWQTSDPVFWFGLFFTAVTYLVVLEVAAAIAYFLVWALILVTFKLCRHIDRLVRRCRVKAA